MQSVVEEKTNTTQNMVSNLPLLFTGGYPTTLEDITEKELEKFIPFMVQCSLGVGSNHHEITEPEWWPRDVRFTIPLTKSPLFREDWLAKMKEIVVICYEFHNSIFLLRFCNELASYERECLRFINNYNSTTSLYERVSNRLLVTFRNENMLYDQQQQQNNIRRCLLPRSTSSQSSDRTSQMVEPALFDIYLCDNCDAELYSLQAFKEHEKGCQSDDDVIICEPDEIVESSDENHKKLSAFLSNFNLQSIIPTANGRKISTPQKEMPGSPEKMSRASRRTRGGVVALSRCPTVPFSSPLGQFLIKKSKSPSITEDYVLERLERIDRFSYAPSLENPFRPKWFFKKPPTNFPATYKRPSEHQCRADYHYYKFPRRNFRKRDADCGFLNSFLLRKCKPCSVQIKKLSEMDVNHYNMNIKLRRLNNNNYSIVSNTFNQAGVKSDSNSSIRGNNGSSSSSGSKCDEIVLDDDNENIRPVTEATQKVVASSGKVERVVAFIDLCSSDEEEEKEPEDEEEEEVPEEEYDDNNFVHADIDDDDQATITYPIYTERIRTLIPTAPKLLPSNSLISSTSMSSSSHSSKIDGNILSIPFEMSQTNQHHGGVITSSTSSTTVTNVATANTTFPTGSPSSFILNLPKSQPLQPVYLFSNNNFYDKIPQLVKIKNSLTANL